MTAGGDSDNIVGVGGNIDFALPVVAPTDDGAIRFKPNRAIAACSVATTKVELLLKPAAIGTLP